jgi:hypothetical protein
MFSKKRKEKGKIEKKVKRKKKHNVRTRVFNAGLLVCIRKILRPTNSINVFCGFSWSLTKC